MPSRKVLCVSFDKLVSESRFGSLRNAGYDVTPRTNVKDGLDLLDHDKFDAIIIDQRFSLEEKYRLAVRAKERADTLVVLICGATPASEIPATSRVYALEGTAGVLSALSRLFSAETAARAQAAA